VTQITPYTHITPMTKILYYDKDPLQQHLRCLCY